MTESVFSLNQIMYLDFNFYKLVSTRGSSCVKLPSLKALEKAVINQTKNEQCFKSVIIAALYHEEIVNDPQRISNLQHYKDQYNWNGTEFPLTFQTIGKCEKSNPDIAVNVLFNSKNGIYTPCRSELNGKSSKEANSLMIVDGKIETTLQSRINQGFYQS